MNHVIEEMKAILDVDENALKHYGMPRRSGRYPFGSGENPYQHSMDFLGRVEEMRKAKATYTDETGKVWTGDTAIAKSLGLSTSEFRTEIGLAKNERNLLRNARVKSLSEDGLGPTEIGKEMGLPESTVRSILNSKNESRLTEAQNTANSIKKIIDEKGMIDVGAGVEKELNISKERLNQALYILEREGYPVYSGGISQPTNPGQQTTQKVICPPGTEHREIYNYDKVHSMRDYISRDGGDSFEKKFTYPASMDSKRMKIRYSEDGGIEKDGIIELRRGVDDLSLGESKYAQVRILVDGTHYLKGMAVYSDDMPKGIDVIFNTNKPKGTPQEKVLKEIKSDPDNPFGSLIKDAEQGGQYWYTDKKTGERKLGLINKRADEGDWTDWQDTLPSQFLSKQSKSLAKKQLNLAKADKLAEFDEICSVTNPTIKKQLLSKFADECDSAAVHLKAAALPGQKYHVIVPINTLKDSEIYAPGYESGTKLALVRYPHGGTFEIPILTVNNRNQLGNKVIGKTSIDAVGITKNVADRLSGADFDGDTVMCIPTHDAKGKVKITSTNSLKGLEGFDPKMEYPEKPGMKYMKDPKTGKDNTQNEMGRISNLITDMTLAGATNDELAAAVRHSMVVIDAGKHKLDYKQSELDNNIRALRNKYQRKYDEDGNFIRSGGASTIISRASGETQVLRRQGTPKVNLKGTSYYDPDRPEGSLIYKTSDKLTYEYKKINKRTGEETIVTKTRHQPSTNMAETDDANTLVSKDKHPMELLYADYANSMKALANRARLEELKTGKIPYSKSANDIYQTEVKSLNDKLNTALLNSPKEREVLRRANVEVALKKEADPTIKPGDIRKLSQQAVTKYRQEVGAVARKKRNIDISDKEWEAIQAGAISENKLKKILDNTDIAELRERATPRNTSTLSAAKVNKIKQMNNSNYSLAEIAASLGVSTSTVSKYLKGVS
jgi:predicted transcriptional regulator